MLRNRKIQLFGKSVSVAAVIVVAIPVLFVAAAFLPHYKVLSPV